MKVYIGPYTPWWQSRIHTNYMDKKYDYDWSENKTWFEDFLERVEDTLQVFYNATINRYFNKKERKIKVRIDHYDVWNADHTLALIIAPLLRKLEKHGTPATDREDAPADPIYDDEKTDYEWDSGYSKARWEYILGEMIYAFEMKLDEDWDLEIYKNGGWSEENLAKRRAIQERINNGFRLFGKYYNNLWT